MSKSDERTFRKLIKIHKFVDEFSIKIFPVDTNDLLIQTNNKHGRKTMYLLCLYNLIGKNVDCFKVLFDDLYVKLADNDKIIKELETAKNKASKLHARKIHKQNKFDVDPFTKKVNSKVKVFDHKRRNKFKLINKMPSHSVNMVFSDKSDYNVICDGNFNGLSSNAFIVYDSVGNMIYSEAYVCNANNSFESEARAIENALNYLNIQFANKKILIITDCQDILKFDVDNFCKCNKNVYALKWMPRAQTNNSDALARNISIMYNDIINGDESRDSDYNP